MHYVYKLLDKNKVFYIGKGTSKEKYDRIEFHKKYSKHNTNRKLKNKINKLNSVFNIEIVFESENEQACLEYEIMLIESIGLHNLCNLTNGGEGLSGYVHTQESRKKMSESKKKKIKCPYCNKIGNVSNMKRYHFDNCKKITGVEKHIGHKHSEETINKIKVALGFGKNNKNYGKSTWMKGKNHSVETIEKIKQKRAEQVLSDETKKKISESVKKSKSKKKYYHTELAKEKMRKPKIKIKCPYCELLGGSSNMKRYHFDNCKNKII